MAREVVVQSWASQRLEFPGVATAILVPVIRLWPVSSAAPLFKLCGRKASWGMSRSNVKQLATSYDAKIVNKHLTQFEFNFDTIKQTMKWSDDKNTGDVGA